MVLYKSKIIINIEKQFNFLLIIFIKKYNNIVELKIRFLKFISVLCFFLIKSSKLVYHEVILKCKQEYLINLKSNRRT